LSSQEAAHTAGPYLHIGKPAALQVAVPSLQTADCLPLQWGSILEVAGFLVQVAMPALLQLPSPKLFCFFSRSFGSLNAAMAGLSRQTKPVASFDVEDKMACKQEPAITRASAIRPGAISSFAIRIVSL